MRAWQINNGFGIENLKQISLPSTTIKPDEIRVKIKSCSLNYRDLMVINGLYNPKQKLPLIPLSDACGEVTEVGAEVSSFSIGDKVASCFFADYLSDSVHTNPQESALGSPLDGVLCEERIFKSMGLVKIPSYLSFSQGATLPCAALTAFNAIFNQSILKPGDHILIMGTGGVSIFALQFANLLGLNCIVISSSDEKLATCKAIGAKYLINYQKNPHWHKEVMEITNGLGVELVVEVSGASTINQSLSVTKRNGHIAMIGILGGNEATINLIPILMNNLHINGIFVGSRVTFQQMNKVLAHTQIKPYIAKEFGFNEVPQALNFMASKKHFGKICITID